jgi:hypothetical protein
MSRKPKAVQQQKKKPVSSAGCVHYWVIESPQGPVSKGICKHCGATSEFMNYMPYPSWEGKMPRLPGREEMSDVEPGEDSNNNS